MIFRTPTLPPFCATLAFATDAGEHRFDFTVVTIHDDTGLGYRLPGTNKALRIQLDAVELPVAEPWYQCVREALEGMLLGKSATIREQGRNTHLRILGAAWVIPADRPTCGHTLDTRLALLTIDLAN